MNTRPVRLPPCAAGASPTRRMRAAGSPKPGHRPRPVGLVAEPGDLDPTPAPRARRRGADRRSSRRSRRRASGRSPSGAGGTDGIGVGHRPDRTGRPFSARAPSAKCRVSARCHPRPAWMPCGSGIGLRALRRHRGWTQAQVARRARVSQAAVSRAECVRAWNLTMRTILEIAEALGARASPGLYWQGEALDRLLDAAHAGLVDQVVSILSADGWHVVPEATFNNFGERGSVDVLAWHPEHQALLIVEVKSAMPDVQALLAGVDRKQRIGRMLAEERGWRVRSVSRLIRDSRTIERCAGDSASTPARSTSPIRRERGTSGDGSRATGVPDLWAAVPASQCNGRVAGIECGRRRRRSGLTGPLDGSRPLTNVVVSVIGDADESASARS